MLKTATFKFKISSDRRILIKKPSIPRFENLMNRLQTKASDTLDYLLDMEELAIKEPELETDAEKLGKAFNEFLQEVNRINPRAHSILIKHFKFAGGMIPHEHN